MSTPSATNTSGGTQAPLDVSQEVRFAVVMYGGVSLAIYINGVTQELLRLVRATAPAERGESEARRLTEGSGGVPKDTDWVYRKLSYLLSDPSLLVRYRDQLGGAEDGGGPKPGADIVDEEVRNGSPIRTRFVIDILSGASAGGINGIYLANTSARSSTACGGRMTSCGAASTGPSASSPRSCPGRETRRFAAG